MTDQEWSYGFKLDPVNDYEKKFVIISQLYYDDITEVTKPTPNDLSGYFFTKLDWTVKVFEIKTDHEFVKYEEKEVIAKIKVKKVFTLLFGFSIIISRYTYMYLIITERELHSIQSRILMPK